MKHWIGISLVAASLLAIRPYAAEAQNRQLMDRLKSASRIDCHFSEIAKGEWTDEGAEFETGGIDYSAAFFDIDVESGTAESEGRFGASYIIVRYAEGYLHFMQTLNSGPLYLTTVLAQESTDGRFKAVQTRHEYTQVSLPGFTSRPEIYLGDCSVE